MIKFSVLLSVYAKEVAEHLDVALNSLALQTMPADEIIIVIDGEIPQVLHRVVDKWVSSLPIKTVYLPNNIGLGNALNIGLMHATYNLIARMDSDDICLRDRFEKQIEYFSNFPETILLGGAITEFETSPREGDRKRFTCSEHQDIVEYSIKRNPFNHMTMMFKKDFIIKAGSYQHHLFMEDYNLWLRCIANGAICHNLNDVLVNARIGSGMLLRRRGFSYFISELQLLRVKFGIFPDSKFKILTFSFVRIISRLLPVGFLSFIYTKIRS